MTQEEIDKLATMISKQMRLCQKEVLTLEEVSEYTGMSKSTLYKLTANRMIPHSKPNGKCCFFYRSKLEDWLMSSPVATQTDLDSEAIAYCTRNKAPLIKRKKTK